MVKINKKFLPVLLILIIIFGAFGYFLGKFSQPVQSLHSFTIYGKDGVYYAEDDYGNIAFQGADGGKVINNAVNSVGLNGGGAALLKGTINRGKTPIDIEYNSVSLSGEGANGDLFFTSGTNEKGFTNKWASSLIAEGIDAIIIGKEKLVFGASIQDLGISGTAENITGNDGFHTSGAGIRVYKANTLKIQDCQVQRKEEGIFFKPFDSGDYLNVIDVVNLENIFLCYKGFYGGSGVIRGSIVSNLAQENVSCFVSFGFVSSNSSQSEVFKGIPASKIANVNGFSP